MNVISGHTVGLADTSGKQSVDRSSTVTGQGCKTPKAPQKMQEILFSFAFCLSPRPSLPYGAWYSEWRGATQPCKAWGHRSQAMLLGLLQLSQVQLCIAQRPSRLRSWTLPTCVTHLKGEGVQGHPASSNVQRDGF